MYAEILAQVDWTPVVTAILQVAALLAGVHALMYGLRIVLSMLEGDGESLDSEGHVSDYTVSADGDEEDYEREHLASDYTVSSKD